MGEAGDIDVRDAGELAVGLADGPAHGLDTREALCTGEGKDLFPSFLVTLLLTLPTLGLCWVWYVARKRRFFWDHTHFGSARFSCSVTGSALLWLWVVNVLLLVCTLGLAWPWARVRNINFSFRNLALIGPLDLARIQQQAQQAGTTGEGLLGFFDSGFDLA